MKINISIDDRLVDKLDEYCDSNFTNRSAVISRLLVNQFRTEELLQSFNRACLAMDTAVKTGVITEKDKAEFESLSQLATMSGFSK